MIFLLPGFVSLDIYLLPAVYNYCSFWFFWCLAMHLDIIYKSKCVIKFIHLKKLKWSIFWDEGSIIYLSLKPIDWWYVTNSKLVLLIRTFRREWLGSWSREESLDCGTTLRKHSQFPFFFLDRSIKTGLVRESTGRLQQPSLVQPQVVLPPSKKLNYFRIQNLS